MSQRFIVSGTKRHAARKKPCQSFEKRHIAWIAAAQHYKGKVTLLQQNRQCIDQQIDALLFRKPSHHADQRSRHGVIEMACRDQQFLIREFATQILRSKMRRQVRIVPRVPISVVDAVQYSDHTILARA